MFESVRCPTSTQNLMLSLAILLVCLLQYPTVVTAAEAMINATYVGYGTNYQATNQAHFVESSESDSFYSAISNVSQIQTIEQKPQKYPLFLFICGMLIPWLIGQSPTQHAHYVAVSINAALCILCLSYIAFESFTHRSFNRLALGLSLAFSTCCWLLVWFLMAFIQSN